MLEKICFLTFLLLFLEFTHKILERFSDELDHPGSKKSLRKRLLNGFGGTAFRI